MSDRGKVIIIPDENKILQDYYEKAIIVNHLEAFQDFSDKYHLGYRFKPEDYQDAPINIAKEGHLAIKTIDTAGLLVVYVPRVVTDRQMEWFYKNIDNYRNYHTIGGFAIEESETKIIEGMDSLNKIMNKRNMMYIRKEENKDVRKEI